MSSVSATVFISSIVIPLDSYSSIICFSSISFLSSNDDINKAKKRKEEKKDYSFIEGLEKTKKMFYDEKLKTSKAKIIKIVKPVKVSYVKVCLVYILFRPILIYKFS